MTTRTPARRPAAGAPRFFADATQAMFRGFDAMRCIQEHAARDLAARHGALALRMRKPGTPAELLALQAQALRADAEAASAYWQQLAAAVLEMQVQVAGCCRELVDADVLVEAAHSFEEG